MRPVTVSVQPALSLRQLTDDYLLPLGLRAVPVVLDERLMGLITLAEVRGVPRERWEGTPVGYVMIPLDRLHIASPEQSLNEILPLMVRQDVNQMPVTQDGRLVGMISRDVIMHYIEVRRSLGMEGMGQRPTDRWPPSPREQEQERSHEPV